MGEVREPAYASPGNGEAFVLLGSEHITFKARGVPGQGCSVFENATQAGYRGPPPHFHLDQDEDFYVLEGEFEFTASDRTVRGAPGAFVRVPKGVVHTFENVGEGVGRLLVVVSPAGGFEAFVEELGEPTREKSPPAPPSGPPDAEMVERVTTVASKHGIEILPPPSEH